MASTVLGGYGEAMRQLVDYPYGCLEQMSSRLVPFVALRELHGVFKLPVAAGQRARLGGTRTRSPAGGRAIPTRWRRRRSRPSRRSSTSTAATATGARTAAARRTARPTRCSRSGAPPRWATRWTGTRSGAGQHFLAKVAAGNVPTCSLVAARRGPRNPGLRAVRAGPDARAAGLERHGALRPPLGAPGLRQGDAGRRALDRRRGPGRGPRAHHRADGPGEGDLGHAPPRGDERRHLPVRLVERPPDHGHRAADAGGRHPRPPLRREDGAVPGRRRGGRTAGTRPPRSPPSR